MLIFRIIASIKGYVAAWRSSPAVALNVSEGIVDISNDLGSPKRAY
jgi:hypothetical protein